MAAYVIGEIEITDPQAYQEYAKGVPATIAQYGGKYMVRGGKVEPKEGGWDPKRVVVLEFSSLDQARKWYDSPEYVPLRALRQRAARGRLIFVEGVA
jgi:uncharacterized protein (DUF1330 family)